MGRRPIIFLAVFATACRFTPDPLGGGGGGGDEADSSTPVIDGEIPVADGAEPADGVSVFDAPTPDAPTPDAFSTACANAGAPAGYTVAMAGRDSCYRVDPDPEWWIDAQADCADDGDGAHLAVLDDAAENDFVWRIKTAGQNVWLGVSDRVTEGDYLWVTDQVTTITPLPWHSGKGGASDEDCVELRDSDRLWNDHDCFSFTNDGYKRRYVCEYDGVPIATANY